MGFLEYFLGGLFLVICLLLIIIILLQKGKGGGLGAAFGGMGSSAFGTRTGDVFTWVTIVLTGLFLLLAVVTSLVFRPTPGKVFMPRFLPPPGAISEPINVEITCQTGDAKIYYTTDGSEPDESSVPYDRSVRIEPGTVIRARAYRANWTPSEVAVGNYPVDANQPASRPALPPLGGPGPAAPPATAPASAPAGGR